jgi:hypothetical protein
MFEWGVASAIAPDSFKVHALTIDDVNEFLRDGLEAVFMRTVHAIAEMQLYDEFGRTGWTRRLATVTRKTLVPNIIKVVTLAWYGAYLEANKEVS